jgi:hypothetical protein
MLPWAQIKIQINSPFLQPMLAQILLPLNSANCHAKSPNANATFFILHFLCSQFTVQPINPSVKNSIHFILSFNFMGHKEKCPNKILTPSCLKMQQILKTHSD